MENSSNFPEMATAEAKPFKPCASKSAPGDGPKKPFQKATKNLSSSPIKIIFFTDKNIITYTITYLAKFIIFSPRCILCANISEP